MAAIVGVAAILVTMAGTGGAQNQTCQEEARRLKADAEAQMASQPAEKQGLVQPVENWFGSPHSRDEVLGKLEEAAEADDEGCAQMLNEAKQLMGATD